MQSVGQKNKNPPQNAAITKLNRESGLSYYCFALNGSSGYLAPTRYPEEPF